MANIKLLSISKNEHRSEYVFPKEQRLFGMIRDILKKLNFKNTFGRIDDFARPADEGGETISDKEDNIKKYNERIIAFTNKNYYINIIFFSKKIAIIFNYNKDKQQEISKIFEEFISEEEI